MKRLTEVAQQQVRNRLQPGNIVIDATLGNGHDCRFLAECVGPTGTVYAIDIQEDAIERSRVYLQENGIDSVIYLQANHARLESLIPVVHHGQVTAIMFNLGYLPSGNKSVITQVESTIPALRAAASMLSPNGILSILAYLGHAGGEEEYIAVREWILTLPQQDYTFQELQIEELPKAPRLFIVTRL